MTVGRLPPMLAAPAAVLLIRHSGAGRNPGEGPLNPVIPAQAGSRRRNPQPRHSGEGRNPGEGPLNPVIPAEAVSRRRNPQPRHSGAGRNPVPCSSFRRRPETSLLPVIPAEAGNQEKGWRKCKKSLPYTFWRTREMAPSTQVTPQSFERESGNIKMIWLRALRKGRLPSFGLVRAS